MEELKQKIKQEISQIPKDRQDAVNSVDWMSVVEKISDNFGLIQEEKESVLLETGLLLMGVSGIEDFSDNIEEHAVLPEKQSEEIAIQIASEILAPIAEKIVTSDKKKEESFSGLPKNITSSTNTQQKIYEISNKYKLPLDKMGEIEAVTNKFINGEISSIKYESELSLISEMPSDKILEIINDINKNIIKPQRGAVIKENDKIIKNEKEIPLPPKPNYQTKVPIPVPPYKQDVVINKPSENKEEKIAQQAPNIITEKLFGNTSSKTVVNDYSIPKVTPLNKLNESVKIVEPGNPHDPYREIL